jgi:23S rRNA (cytidine1920-2'-O)/16S rRNA (cytidine1409-2'-O)-methyltransferase
VDRLGLGLMGAVAADFGCSTGGFTDCLLQEGAVRVYAVDTAHGALAWILRQDPRVVAMERTNAMHVDLPERADVVTIDVGWTAQRRILPNALRQVKPDGLVLSLFKPQYEAPARLVRRGRVAPDGFEAVLTAVTAELAEGGIRVHEAVRLPQGPGRRNPEAFLCIRRAECHPGRASGQAVGEGA